MTTTEQTSWFFRRRRNHVRRCCSLDVQEMTVIADDNTVVFSELSLELEPGTMTCIVGSDQDTTDAFIAAVTGNAKLKSGVVRLNGRDVCDLRADQVEDLVAVIPSEPPVTHGTIWDNISFGLHDVSRFQQQWAADLANVDAVAQSLPNGMNTVIGNGSDVGDTVLSPAHYRRIALARALLSNPSVLILDNPTTGMSSRDEQRFLQTLTEVIGTRAVLMLSSRLAVARKADQVRVLEDGTLVDYDENASRGTVTDHSRLWDRTITNTIASRRPRNQDMRVASRTTQATSPASGFSDGDEIAPDYTAAALIDRTEHTDVWAAWSAKTKEPVKVKLPRQSPVSYDAYEQIRREFQTVHRLRHPGLASALALDLEADTPYAVFEYLDSHSMETLVSRHGCGLDPLDVLFIGFELAGALHYFHNRGRVHLDLRARHLRTRSEHIVISDFTSSRLIGSPLPINAGPGPNHIGEHQMTAPEQRPGAAAHPKMDVYSLGAVLHFLAAGDFKTEDSLCGKRLTPFANIIETAPVALTALLERMLAENPADRPDTEEILDRFGQAIPASMDRPRILNLDERDRAELALSRN